jgi:hypothetical protein
LTPLVTARAAARVQMRVVENRISESMAKKNITFPTRRLSFNRFQASIPGSFVETVTGARFDPYAEPPSRPSLSTVAMESVRKIVIPGAARPNSNSTLKSNSN